MTLCIMRGPPSDTISPCLPHSPAAAVQPLQQDPDSTEPAVPTSTVCLRGHQGASPDLSCRGDLLLRSWRWREDKMVQCHEDLLALSTWCFCVPGLGPAPQEHSGPSVPSYAAQHCFRGKSTL